MAKKNKIAENFKALAAKALLPSAVNLLVIPATDDQEIAFHKMHQQFINMAILQKKPPKFENALHERYPFVKVNGQWQISVPKMYLYLVSARWAMAQFQNPLVQDVYNAVQAHQEYYEKYTALDNALTPFSYDGLEDYTAKQTVLYENLLMKQLSIFGESAKAA